MLYHSVANQVQAQTTRSQLQNHNKKEHRRPLSAPEPKRQALHECPERISSRRTALRHRHLGRKGGLILHLTPMILAMAIPIPSFTFHLLGSFLKRDVDNSTATLGLSSSSIPRPQLVKPWAEQQTLNLTAGYNSGFRYAKKHRSPTNTLRVSEREFDAQGSCVLPVVLGTWFLG